MIQRRLSTDRTPTDRTPNRTLNRIHEARRAHPTRRGSSQALLASLAIFGLMLSAAPSQAAWEGSTAEDVSAKVLDAVLIRPLATVRVVVGAVLFVPASLFAAPSGREGFDGAYDTLLRAPIEYAFKRKLGQD